MIIRTPITPIFDIHDMKNCKMVVYVFHDNELTFLNRFVIIGHIVYASINNFRDVFGIKSNP